jgi:hypothetical protein
MDATTTIKKLDTAALLKRLEEIAAERKAIMVLIRAARARDRVKQKGKA